MFDARQPPQPVSKVGTHPTLRYLRFRERGKGTRTSVYPKKERKKKQRKKRKKQEERKEKKKRKEAAGDLPVPRLKPTEDMHSGH
jgi:peptide methionine sulfoxide reductase MsrA